MLKIQHKNEQYTLRVEEQHTVTSAIQIGKYICVISGKHLHIYTITGEDPHVNIGFVGTVPFKGKHLKIDNAYLFVDQLILCMSNKKPGRWYHGDTSRKVWYNIGTDIRELTEDEEWRMASISGVYKVRDILIAQMGFEFYQVSIDGNYWTFDPVYTMSYDPAEIFMKYTGCNYKPLYTGGNIETAFFTTKFPRVFKHIATQNVHHADLCQGKILGIKDEILYIRGTEDTVYTYDTINHSIAPAENPWEGDLIPADSKKDLMIIPDFMASITPHFVTRAGNGIIQWAFNDIDILCHPGLD